MELCDAWPCHLGSKSPNPCSHRIDQMWSRFPGCNIYRPGIPLNSRYSLDSHTPGNPQISNKLDGVAPLITDHSFTSLSEKKNMWHVTHDMWHVIHDTLHMTCDTWHMTGERGEPSLKLQLLSSYSLWVKVFWRFWGKGWPTESIILITKVFVE